MGGGCERQVLKETKGQYARVIVYDDGDFDPKEIFVEIGVGVDCIAELTEVDTAKDLISLLEYFIKLKEEESDK